MEGIDALFNAKSVAIVGVSQSNTKLGSIILTNLLNIGYEGKIYPVNPKYDSIYGMKCYPKLEDIAGVVELICIVIPKQYVKDVVVEAVNKGIKAAIIISAGFGEINDEGKILENEIGDIAKKGSMRILGPNCLGVISPFANINLSFAASYPTEGNIAFLSQSGAFCTAVLDKSIPHNVGFSHFVSMGNTVDINETDLIPYFQNDPKVKVITAYLEEMTDGIKLMKQYQSFENPKPLIMFKSGRSDEAKLAVASHTGSIAGSNEVFDTAVQQNGIISISSMRSMYNLMKGFSWSPLPKGNRIAIVTNAGGPGIIATDAIIEGGLSISQLSEETQTELRGNLPETANTHNPVDVGGDALSHRFKSSIETLIKDDNVDAVLVILTPQYITQIEETARNIVNISKLSNKPIIPVFLGEKYASLGMQRLLDNKIVVYDDILDAVEVFSTMYKFQIWKNEKKTAAPTYIPNSGHYRAQIEQISKKDPIVAPDNLVMQMMEEMNIRVPKQKFCINVEEALEFSKDKYPVVLKAPNSVLAHKIDVKGVLLNLKDEESLREAFTELTSTLSNMSGSKPEYLLVQKQIKFKEELILGTNRDGDSDVYSSGGGFGHLMLFGKGGIYTQIYNDHSYVLLPASREQIAYSVSKTHISEILRGARGQNRLAVDRLVDTMESVQKLLLTYPEIVSLDINPLFIDEGEVTAIDVKMFLQK